ncbi:hypothetical protein [Streptomyces sp. NRRL S-495]|nr:hypothetical protein [Streptomyces sp. NRRL S-495]
MFSHHDGVQSFSNFEPFEGWSAPTAKIYNQGVVQCGVSVDPVWQP